MKKNIYIRRATPEDAYNIKKIHVETYKKSYRGIVPNEYLNNMPLDDDVIERTKKYLETAECWLAFIQNESVGFAYVSDIENKTFEINALYIHPDFQKQGIGSHFVDFLCQNKKAKGCLKCILWTMKFGPALPFYEKLDFKRTNEEKIWKFEIPIIKLQKEL